MNKWFRHSIATLILASYIILGIVGHLEAFSLFSPGTTPYFLIQTKTGPQPTSKVYWTQNKHIPATVKISVPSAAIFTPPESHRVFIDVIAFLQSEFYTLSDPSTASHSSRAPPQL